VDNKSHDKGVGAQSHGVNQGHEVSVINQGVNVVVKEWIGTDQGQVRGGGATAQNVRQGGTQGRMIAAGQGFARGTSGWEEQSQV
jgi:hypothetical protein